MNLKCCVEIGKDTSIDELLEKYNIIFLATGAWKPTRLKIPGEDKALIAFDILRQIKNGKQFN